MAAGDIYGLAGTPRVWRDSGGDATMGLSSLAAANLREGARYDFGAAAKPMGFSIGARAQWVATPAAQTMLEIYLAAWDDEATPGDAWGNLAGNDTNYSSAAGIAKRNSCLLVGGVLVETAAVGPYYWGIPFVYFPFRYVSVLAYNSAAVALAASGTFASLIRLTPRYAQLQS
jgi:hypothetical protein